MANEKYMITVHSGGINVNAKFFNIIFQLSVFGSWTSPIELFAKNELQAEIKISYDTNFRKF